MAQVSVRDTAASQFRVEYDANNYLDFTIDATGKATLTPTGTAPSLVLNSFKTAFANITDRPTTLEGYGIVGGVLSSILRLESAAALPNGGALNSPDLILRGFYDSDATAAVVATKRDFTLRNIVAADGSYRLAALNDAGAEVLGLASDGQVSFNQNGTIFYASKDVRFGGIPYPSTNGTVDLGGTGNRWNTLYGVNGNFIGTIQGQTTASNGNFTLSVAGGTTIEASNGGIKDITTTGFRGKLIIAMTNVGRFVGEFLVETSDGIVHLTGQTPHAIFTTTKDSVNKINVYMEAGALKIQNNSGGYMAVRCMILRLH